MALWIGIAVIGTYAMGSATNHFFSKDSKEQGANVSGSAAASGSDGASRHGIWWNPATDPIDASIKDSGVTLGSGSSSSSDGNSIIPVDRNAGFSSGSLIVNGATRIGSNSATYSILGLGTRSFSSSSMSPSIAKGGLGASELHFSLGGDLTRVPVDNLATGGMNVLTLAAVPEPSTVGLLAMALAGFAVRRRRRPVVVT